MSDLPTLREDERFDSLEDAAVEERSSDISDIKPSDLAEVYQRFPVKSVANAVCFTEPLYGANNAASIFVRLLMPLDAAYLGYCKMMHFTCNSNVFFCNLFSCFLIPLFGG